MLYMKGKIVMITGASSRIGWAVAEQMAAEGAHLILCGRREERLKKLQSQLNSQKSYRTEEERIEYQKECNKNYREEHKEELNMKAREKIVCDNCGCIISKSFKSKHIKTDKCINFKKET